MSISNSTKRPLKLHNTIFTLVVDFELFLCLINVPIFSVLVQDYIYLYV